MKTKLLTFVIALITAVSAWAYDFKSGDLCYNITGATNRTVEVTRESYGNNYSSLPGAVTIPETVTYNGSEYSVKGIGDGAFDCPSLTEINVESSNTAYSSENGVLFNKDKTTLIQYPIGKKETSYTIPNSVTSMGQVFSDCKALTEINVETGNTAYSSENGVLFNKDKSLLIQYPIGKKETSYTIPNSVTGIIEHAFRGCSTLAQVIISSSMTIISDQAFSGCSSLTQITIPNSVTRIGYNAFSDCKSLTQVTIPNSVTYIESGAFQNCSALTQVTIGNSVTYIGNYAFSKCSALTQISIPNSVTGIGDGAFQGCSALTQMTVLATEPPSLDYYTFFGVSRNIPVYVPDESLDTYKVTEIWNEFNLWGISTGIMAQSLPESITVSNGILQNPQALQIGIYNLQGSIIYSGNATTLAIQKGIYLVRCGEACVKVMF